METINSRNGGPYDDYYASVYNSIWWNSTAWQAEAKFHIQTISELIKPGTKWLDAGCGTGYFLSQFPEVVRAGFDFSPAMLNQARKANQTALFLKEMSLIDHCPEWDNNWDLVTCTGQPWSYFKTMEEIEKTAANLARWTSKNGYCVLTPLDISDFAEHQIPMFFDDSNIPRDIPIVTGIHWRFTDLDTTEHKCISPNLDQWVRWFSKYFYKVEILRWPHEPAILRIPRRVIVCSEKRNPEDTRPALIFEHPVPRSNDQPEPEEWTPESSLSNGQLLKEIIKRVRSGVLIKAMVKKVFHY